MCLRWGWSLRENDGVICKKGERKRKRAQKKEMKGREENNKVVRKKLGWGRRRETEKKSALVCSVLKGVQTFVVFPGYSIWFKPPKLHKKELLCLCCQSLNPARLQSVSHRPEAPTQAPFEKMRAGEELKEFVQTVLHLFNHVSTRFLSQTLFYSFYLTSLMDKQGQKWNQKLCKPQ